MATIRTLLLLLLCVTLPLRTAAAQTPSDTPTDEVATLRWGFELACGPKSVYRDAYADRLEQFGFDWGGNGWVKRTTAAVGR